MSKHLKSEKFLSQDLLIAIFLQFPVKSLPRLRCVCKFWYQIICNTSFVKAHHKTCSTTTKYLLLEDHNLYKLCQESLIHKPRKFRNYRYTPNLLDMQYKHDQGIEVYGSCNGLLCLSDYYLDDIFCNVWLWNPIVGKAKKLPDVPYTDHKHNARLCFGYFDDDYKVIKLGLSNLMYCVAVYILSTENWKITDGYRGDYTALDPSRSALFVNGTAYFGLHGVILSFALRDQRIEEISYPEELSSHPLEVYGDSIALMQAGSGFLAMWILRNSDDIAMPSSYWEKTVVINFQSVGDIYPLGFMGIDEYMVKTKKGGDLYLCDLGNSELRTLKFRINLENLIHVNPFVESLALLDEKDIGPSAEPKGCSSHPVFTLHKINKGWRKIAPNVQNKRKLEDTATDKEQEPVLLDLHSIGGYGTGTTCRTFLTVQMGVMALSRLLEESDKVNPERGSKEENQESEGIDTTTGN